MATVWDPAGSYDGSFFATSPDGLKAWMTGSGAGYFLLASKTMTWNTGKYYWEVVWTGSLGQSQTGMAVPGAMGASFSGNWRYEILSGTNPVLRSLRPSTGSAGTTIALGASMLAAPGDVLMFAYDSVASKLWLGLNGSWYNGGDPAAGTGATQSVDGGYDFLPFVAFSLQGELSQAATIAPQTTAYSAPSGFSTLDLPPPDVALPSFSYSLNVLDKAPAQFSEEYRLSAKELRQGVLADRWSIPGNAIWTPVVTAVHYRLTLRQAGHEDLELPMQSFQSRIRQGRPSFLEVYVPGVLDFLDGITDRADGELVIEMGSRKTDGTTDILEIARVNLEEVRYDRGPVSATGTLTGHKTQTFAGGKTVTLSDVELVSSATNLRVRTRVSNDILPGDEIHAGGVSFSVDVIQHIVSTSQAYMELSDG